jgi:glutathione synthase/RimK-type ligase-like ATP-grasp enzyme
MLRVFTQKGQYVQSKWKKTNVLLENQPISKFIPETQKIDESVLESMLNEYKMVYLKPIKGTYGKGVIRVEKQQEDDITTFFYQQGTVKRRFISLSALFMFYMKTKMKGEYMVQQGIHLLKYKKCIFDLRIMVQKNPKGRWESTGIIVRVANPKKIITNYHSGGTPMPFRTIFKTYMTDKQVIEFDHYLKKFGHDIAVVLSKKYPSLNMLGIDVGVDNSFYPWIIEVNTKPDLFIFKKLKDKEIFRKMYRYAKKLKKA